MSRPTRRAVLAGLGVAAVAVVPGPAGPVAAAAPATVSMEAVLKAAQWDPVKAGTGLTPGARGSVLAVESALADRGLLDPSLVDGHFGTATVAAYAAWQRSLGYSGLGATGLPGPASLRALGQGRFTVRRVVDVGARTTHQGFPMNTRTLRMLQAAQARAGMRFVVEQGSYSPGVDPTSRGTHDGGGALDLDAEGLTPAARTAAVRALRQVGFAAWVRSPGQGSWPWHIHAVAISDTDLAPRAFAQVGRYYEGRDGLARNGPDDGPAVRRVTYEEFLRG